MKTTIATHPNPHVDDICGIWLLTRLHPRFRHARVRFIPQGKPLARGIVGVGIGKGVYDEHKGDVDEAAATLVWKDVKKYVKDAILRDALAEIVEWVKDEDHAKFMGVEHHEFSLATVAMNISRVKGCNSNIALEWGMRGLDAALIVVAEKHRLKRDWKRKKVFDTKWGRGVALTTDVASAQVGSMSMKEGYVMFIVVNPKTRYRYIKSADRTKRVNLTAAYDSVRRLEPNAEWYLHHSKRMLICGSDVAQNKHLSSLSIDELIALVARKKI